MTAEPTELMESIEHDRSPVIIAPEDREAWLDADTPVEHLRLLMTPWPHDDFAVDKRDKVGKKKPKDDEPSLL